MKVRHREEKSNHAGRQRSTLFGVYLCLIVGRGLLLIVVQEAIAIFQRIDRDKDGLWSMSDFRTGYASL